MPTILLIRHGETDYIGKKLAGHLPGIHINKNGFQQANKLAEKIARFKVAAIYSSPLERAVETATPIANIKNLPVKIAPGLCEVNFGRLQGKTVGQLRRLKVWKQVYDDPSLVHFPGGENFIEAQSRAVAEIYRILGNQEKDDWIVCVSHADTIRLLISFFLGTPLNNFHRLVIDPASISTLRFMEDRVQLININLTLENGELPN